LKEASEFGKNQRWWILFNLHNSHLIKKVLI